MAITRDIIDLLDKIAPFELSEKWDNCGLQCGDMAWKVKKILVALDVSKKVLQAASDWNADAIVTHHPLLID